LLFFTDLATKIITNGPKQEDHFRTGQTRLIFSRRSYSYFRVIFSDDVDLKFILNVCYYFSVFAGCPIPYPKREFLTDDDQDDKDKRQQATNVCFIYYFSSVYICFYVLRYLRRIQIVLYHLMS